MEQSVGPDRAEGAGAILVVDDTPENILAMEAALSDMADEIVTARSGAEALRRLLERDFAVLLLDVSMPEMDGYETARLIRSRERNRSVPIIFLTAYDRDEGDVLRAYDLGAVDFLFKPIQTPILRAKVSVFVELKRRTDEVVRAAAMARRVEDERRNAQRLAEIDRRKDEFLAVLGHELRTPLATMTAGLELAERPDVDAAGRARVHDSMKRQLAHLVRLVDDLLDVSRIRTGRIELRRREVELTEVLDRAVDLARSELASRGHALAVERPEVPVTLDVDPVRIVQAVSNLLHNAARYTPKGGHIALAARCRDGRVVVSVEDDGRGIAPDALDRVFDMFAQERVGNDGLGLGLALARQLVELHGGTIRAHSEGLGRGTRFEIELPAARVAASPPRAGPRSASPTRANGDGTGARVVVVEDDDDLRETLCALLRSWGHDVTEAATGEAGLRAIGEAHPDIALIDIGLPDIDGYRVAERVRSDLRADTRLIALTGFTQAEDRARVAAAGFDQHLAKPPDIQQLRALIAEARRDPHGTH